MNYSPLSHHKLVTLPDGLYDAFGRLRTSDPVTIFDSQQQYGQGLLFWEHQTVNNGVASHLPNESAVRLRTTTTDTDSVVRQTRQYFRYQPGKSLMALVTFQMTSDYANRVQRVGYFDANNGIFVERDDDGTVYVVKRSYVSGSPVDTKVAQADWNGNKLDGTIGSHFKLDITKSQIFFCDLEWLGVGTVRVGFVINGKPIVVHEFHHANIGSTVYMTTANLPIRYEITNTGETAGNGDMIAICCSVISEGGFEESRGVPFSADTTSTPISVDGTEKPIISLRPASTINGITNRAGIEIESLSVFSDAESVICRIYYGGTLTSPTFAVNNATYSGVEVDKVATAVSGGLKIGSFMVPAGGSGNNTSPSATISNLLSKLPFSLNIAGGHPTTPFSDVYTLTAQRIGATGTATVTASASWREIY